jgi:hypothetical protein
MLYPRKLSMILLGLLYVPHNIQNMSHLPLYHAPHIPWGTIQPQFETSTINSENTNALLKNASQITA